MGSLKVGIFTKIMYFQNRA